DDLVSRLDQLVGDRLEQRLAELRLTGLRFVQQRHEGRAVFGGGALHVGLVRRDDQPDVVEELPDRAEIEGLVGKEEDRFGVVFNRKAPRGDENAPHLVGDLDALRAHRKTALKSGPERRRAEREGFRVSSVYAPSNLRQWLPRLRLRKCKR